MDRQQTDKREESENKEPVSQGGPLGISRDKSDKKEGALGTTKSAPPQGPSS